MGAQPCARTQNLGRYAKYSNRLNPIDNTEIPSDIYRRYNLKSNARGAIVLRAIAEGKTLNDAGKSIGVSGNRASQLLYRICRELDLPSEIADIRRHKEECVKKIEGLENSTLAELHPKIAENLARVLRLGKVEDLTPEYLSNLSASQLLTANLTLVAVAEAQEWLVKNGTSLKRRPPEGNVEMQAVQRAISTLDAFQFDTTLVRSQLQFLIDCDDD